MKAFLLAMLNAAFKAYPGLSFLWDILRPYVETNAPDDVILIGGSPVHAGTPQDDVTALMVEFLTGLLDKATRPLVKAALRAAIFAAPFLVGLAWKELFPTSAKTFAAAKPDEKAVLAAADKE